MNTTDLNLVWGVGAIGQIINRSYAATYHLIQSGQLPPVRRLGSRYVADRQKLIEFFLADRDGPVSRLPKARGG